MNRHQQIRQEELTYARVIGANIVAYRERKKIPQNVLADSLCISPASLSQIEQGKRVPTIRTAHKIARALRVGVNHLLLGIPG